MEVNILITSVSRKVWLVKAFKDALGQVGVRGKVVSADMNELSAGLYVSDRHYLVPPVSDTDFLKAILDICEKENIGLLIPTSDGELLFFAEKKGFLAKKGVQVMVSSPEVIKTCNDKYLFYRFLLENNIPTPATFLTDHCHSSSCQYPLILKPRYGSGGSGVVKINNEEELRFFIKRNPDSILQEFIDGREYSVDVFADFKGNIITVIPRERIETMCGESYKGRTVSDCQITKYAENITKKIKAIGHLTIQCIKNDKGTLFFEMNPRFGGGAMLGIKAGGNTPLFLVNLMLGETVQPQIGKHKVGLTMLRYTEDLLL